MKIMSVDYGDARTGIAFCDKNEILATAFATINESYQPKLIEKIKIIAKSRNDCYWASEKYGWLIRFQVRKV